MIRDTPQPGDIGLTTILGPVGLLVRIGQWLNGDGFGAYQHAFIVLPGDRLIEAQPGGARIAPLAEYDGRDVLYVSPPGRPVTTTHETAAIQLLHDMTADPAWADDLARATAGLRHRYPKQSVRVIGQTRERPAYWPPEQIAAFTYVAYRLAHGLIARGRIRVGSTPRPDSDRAGNAERLSRVGAPFTACLDLEQNGADSDGTLSWRTTVKAWRATGVPVLNAHVYHGTIHAPFELKPFSAPLEVGYTKPSRTLHHLMVEGAVARWAYDSTDIDLLVDIERLGEFVAARPLPAGIEMIRVV